MSRRNDRAWLAVVLMLFAVGVLMIWTALEQRANERLTQVDCHKTEIRCRDGG